MFNHSVVNETLCFLNDIPRNAWYQEQLRKLAPGKTVMEIGCGSGLLAAYALESAAKYYHGIDIRANRVQFTQELLRHLGYHDRSRVWVDDFCQLTQSDIPDDIDLLLCEQTGHQFQNNFTIRQFWQHARKILSKPYISLPDEWGIDVQVYASMTSDQSELQHKMFLDDVSLPQGYFQFVTSAQPISPVFAEKGLFSITPDNCERPVSFVLDLQGYASATVIISDYISYKSQRCNSVSAAMLWPGPIKITVPDAGAVIEFRWDSTLRQGASYTKGFWTYKNVG